MTVRQDMMKAARRGAMRIDADAVAKFAAGRLVACCEPSKPGDVPVRERDGGADLYYAMFALTILDALGKPAPQAMAEYLNRFWDGKDLDLVHLCCLIRCRAILMDHVPHGKLSEHDDLTTHGLSARIENFRTGGGGYAGAYGAKQGEAYAAFLALGAYQDLWLDMPYPTGLAGSVESLRCPGGGYANAHNLPVPSTPATAAAVVTLHHLVVGRPVENETANWLLARRCDDGGFAPFEEVQKSDLLSTAVALHALAHIGPLPADLRSPCERFVLSLRSNDGGFRGSSDDGYADAEYTFYALLALGQLAGPPAGES